MKDLFTRIKNGESSNAELTLTGICLLLIGVLIGMLIAPARFFVAGSFNGNQGSLKAPGGKKKKKQEQEK